MKTNLGEVEHVKTDSDGQFTTYIGLLSDGRYVGWGPNGGPENARILSKDEIEYHGVEHIKKCPMCGHWQ